MSKLLKQFLPLDAMMMAAAQCPSIYDDDRHYTPTPREKPKSYDEQLAAKGLSNFVINGENIIAHNEREAQKRYEARHKK